jgi:hypothetical protein
MKELSPEGVGHYAFNILVNRTVIETPAVQKQLQRIWTEEEWLRFITWIAGYADAGAVIPRADGARKAR